MATRKNRKPGRPSKRTAENEDLVMRALRVGLSLTTAARFASMHKDTLFAWKAEDEAFSDRCEKAMADAVFGVTARLVEQVISGNVVAMIFWLKTRTEEFRERREITVLAPEEFAARVKDHLGELEAGL